MNKPTILEFNSKDWAFQISLFLQREIQGYLESNGKCSVVLTGGETAFALYKTWALLDSFKLNRNVSFYFGDERCIALTDSNSNYNLVLKSLFANGVPSSCSVFRMEADESDIKGAILRYETVLPENPDILLLGLGGDGHIASLFPGSAALLSTNRKVVMSKSPKFPFERVTITRQVIAGAKSLYLLACGQAKGRILAAALNSREDFISLPVRLTLSGNWLIDNEAAEQINMELMNNKCNTIT